MTFCYVDTETLGLDLDLHDVWELAWAIENGDIQSGFLVHDPTDADPKAMEVNQYKQRYDADEVNSLVEYDLLHEMHEARDRGDALILVGANPSFDSYRLRRRWNQEPWHYRMVDLGTYAMVAMNSHEPIGLIHIANWLRNNGYRDEVPLPDHTAAGDVATARGCHKALMTIYSSSNIDGGGP